VAGLFLVLEGPEGAGKSTQSGLLAAWLEREGWRVVATREPGGTLLGEKVRDVLLGPQGDGIRAEAEVLLYSAARTQHVAEVIRPALRAGSAVVCDRFVDSTLAYQGGGHGLPLGALLAVQAFATGGLEPDLRLLLDLPVREGLARRFHDEESVNRMDRADLAFHERVRETYHQLAAASPAGWRVIDASGTIDAVSGAVTAAVSGWLAVHRPTSTPEERDG
jgi:dTMP kinase